MCEDRAYPTLRGRFSQVHSRLGTYSCSGVTGSRGAGSRITTVWLAATRAAMSAANDSGVASSRRNALMSASVDGKALLSPSSASGKYSGHA